MSSRAITNPFLANHIPTVTAELGQSSETNIPKTDDSQGGYDEGKDQSVKTETDEDEEDKNKKDKNGENENKIDDIIDPKLCEL